MTTARSSSGDGGRHWDLAFDRVGETAVSWFQPAATVSLKLIGLLEISLDAAIIDVGAGSSRLVDELVERDFQDVTLLDVSKVALGQVRRRLKRSSVQFLAEDVLQLDTNATVRLVARPRVVPFPGGSRRKGCLFGPRASCS